MAEDNTSAACSPNQNALGFQVELRGDVRVLAWHEGGCRPATVTEIALWDALAAAEAELERERMRLAACSTAALGYFNPDECLPEYRSAALQDVLTLRERAAEAEKAAIERCAKVCEKRAELRFEEHGYTEPDTNAGYYVGEYADLGDALDEEDADCAAAIRALSPPKGDAK